MPDHLIKPHGGDLVDLLVDDTRAAELRETSRDWPSWDLTDRQVHDLELLLTGGFSPLRGFMARADYESVVESMRLADGTLWPMPITLDVTESFADSLEPDQKIALRDSEGVMLAALTVSDVWTPEKRREAEAVFGTANAEHPAAGYLFNEANPVYVGGTLEGIQRPVHYDFRQLRLPLPKCGPGSPSWGGARWWRSRPATRCTVPTLNSPGGPQRKSARTY